jgi:hypothetical protein
MKKYLLLPVLLAGSLAFGQGVLIPPKTVLSVVNGVTRPVAGATITVCPANAAGIPCSPALQSTVFQDAGLTIALPNPFPTDANGNYQFAVASGSYTVTESAAGFVGYSYQISPSSGGTSSFPPAPPAVATFPGAVAIPSGPLSLQGPLNIAAGLSAIEFLPDSWGGFYGATGQDQLSDNVGELAWNPIGPSSAGFNVFMVCPTDYLFSQQPVNGSVWAWSSWLACPSIVRNYTVDPFLGTVQTPSVFLTSTNSHPGQLYFAGNTVQPALPANTFGFSGPASTSFTSYSLVPSTTAPSGTQVFQCSTPNGSGYSACSWGTSSSNPNLNAISAASASGSIANGNFPITWNWALSGSTTGITFGESVASAGSTNEVTISTLSGSTSNLLNLSQGSQTGSIGGSVINIASTFNNASLAQYLINVALTNTTSAAASGFLNFLGGASATTQEFTVDRVGNILFNGTISGTGNASAPTMCGGGQPGASCISSFSGQIGGSLVEGGHNSSANALAKSGWAILSGGLLTNATPNAAALEGVVQIQAGYLKGSAIANQGDVVCGTTTAFTVTDCALAATNVVGIADTTTNPIGVVAYGTALVKFDGAVTLGDNACAPPASTGTAGLAHDNGTTVCPSGQAVGVIVANSGTITIATGATQTAVAMSTTLALVQLHISQ